MTYRYVTKAGCGVVREYEGEPPKTITIDGEKLRLAGAPGGKSRTACGTWPMTSVMAGCHPDDIPKERAHDAKHGVKGTEYKPDGSPVWNSPGHRKRWCEARNIFDRNAGYGDPVLK